MIYLHKYHRGTWHGCIGFRRFATAEQRERLLQRAYGRCGWSYELAATERDPLAGRKLEAAK